MAGFQHTNYKFIDKTKQLVGTRTQKADLPAGDRDDNVIMDEAILKHILKDKISTNGWVVDLDGKKYHCSYERFASKMPPCIEETDKWIPKKKTVCNVTIDKKSKVYKITKIIGLDDSLIVDEKGITIKESSSQIKLTKSDIEIDSKSLTISDGNTEISTEEEGNISLKAGDTKLELKQNQLTILSGDMIIENRSLKETIKKVDDMKSIDIAGAIESSIKDFEDDNNL